MPEYTRQALMDTSVVRLCEAKHLLEAPCSRHRRRDGAVTCALLAVECALKALILQQHQVNRVSDLPDKVHKRLFKGADGHSLSLLLAELHGTQGPIDKHVRGAIQELHTLDRYAHRYGAFRPTQEHAEPRIAQAERVVAWTQQELAR